MIRRFVLASLTFAGLALTLAAQQPAGPPVCTKICCTQHFDVANGFLEQLVAIQQEARKESVTQFAANYDRQKAKTFLVLAANALGDIAAHFGQLNDNANQAAAANLSARLQAEARVIETASTDALAKKKLEALNLDLHLPKAEVVAATPPAAGTPAQK